MKSLRVRFWSKVKKTSGCWLWTGANNGGKWPYGHLRVKLNGQWKNLPAHRISWLLEHGNIPADAMVLHRCDNTQCVRPDHLFLGSAKANTDDMRAKGREKFWGGQDLARSGRPPHKRVMRKCQYCATPFAVEPKHPDAKFCSRTCSSKGRARSQLSPESLASYRQKRGWD